VKRKHLLTLEDLLTRAFRATDIFTIRLSVFLSAKQPFLQPRIPSQPLLLLLRALTPTVSLFELPKTRLPPEGGAHIPRNTGQALHNPVHFWATPRNLATLLQNHQSKTIDQPVPESLRKQGGIVAGVTCSVAHYGAVQTFL